MDILETILSAQGGAAAREAGQSVGLTAEQTSVALSALVPALAAALHRNATQQGGLDTLVNAVQSGGHERHVEQPSTIGSQETVTEGNSILGHILGSKDVSRAVATQAAARTGIGADVLKRLLPLAATLVMGALARQQGGRANTADAGGGDLISMLTPMLDQNQDGSIVDDLLNKAGKLFGGR